MEKLTAKIELRIDLSEQDDEWWKEQMEDAFGEEPPEDALMDHDMIHDTIYSALQDNPVEFLSAFRDFLPITIELANEVNPGSI